MMLQTEAKPHSVVVISLLIFIKCKTGLIPILKEEFSINVCQSGKIIRKSGINFQWYCNFSVTIRRVFVQMQQSLPAIDILVRGDFTFSVDCERECNSK